MDQTDGQTTLAKGILVAGWTFSDGKAAGHGIDPVCEADYGSQQRLGQFSTGTNRQIVFVNGGGHCRFFAIEQGIVTTDNSLQGRKLTNHLGE